MQGTILKPSPNPQLVFKHRLRSHVADPAQTLCSPLKTIFESIKCVAKPFPSSNISIDKNNQRSWHILQDSMFPRRGPSPARVLKDMIASARSHPVEEKPEWWWRTLACLPYLMNFYDHRTWTYAYQISSSNPSPLLNMWESCTFPLIFSISRLPPAIISGYVVLCYFGIVR